MTGTRVSFPPECLPGMILGCLAPAPKPQRKAKSAAWPRRACSAEMRAKLRRTAHRNDMTYEDKITSNTSNIPCRKFSCVSAAVLADQDSGNQQSAFFQVCTVLDQSLLRF